MTKIRALVVAFVLVSCSCFAAAQEEGAQSVDQAWKKAILAGDVDALIACYATDAVGWFSDFAPAKGKEAIRQVYITFFQANIVKDVTFTNTHYHLCGDMAVGWGEYTFITTNKAGDNKMTSTGRFTEVAKKENGKWVYAVDHASDNPAPKG
jgi:uncharacterized protein (TIGR02246 family)